ncbi:MAG: tetratricopeptide repeat protein [Pseudomonadota bacterium]
MASYNLEEEEQLEEIKTWWKQYGNRLLALLTVVLLVVSAYLAWHSYQARQSAQAAVIYGALQEAVMNKNAQGIKTASGELLEKFGGFPRTPYASLGALVAAKALLEEGASKDLNDVKTAKAQLSWVVEHGQDELRELARLRLAAVLLDEKSYDEALKLLTVDVSKPFAARFAQSRGDILQAQGKRAEARSAYEEALRKLSENKTSTSTSENGRYEQILQEQISALETSS